MTNKNAQYQAKHREKQKKRQRIWALIRKLFYKLDNL